MEGWEFGASQVGVLGSRLSLGFWEVEGKGSEFWGLGFGGSGGLGPLILQG